MFDNSKSKHVVDYCVHAISQSFYVLYFEIFRVIKIIVRVLPTVSFVLWLPSNNRTLEFMFF